MPPQPPPFISVVIPTYNHAALLGDAIESLKAQDYPPDRYEIVVSDDGSTDNTASVAEAAQRDAQVRLLYERRRHGGVNAARNAGIEAASGEIICLLDADEMAPPGWLSVIEEQFRSDAGLVSFVGGPYRAFGRPRFRTCRDHATIGAYEAEGELPLALGGNMAMHRRVLDAVGHFDPSLSGLGDETEWQRRALSAGFSLSIVPTMWVYHRRDLQSPRELFSRRFKQARGGVMYGLRTRGDSVNESLFALLLAAGRCLGHLATKRCFTGWIGVADALGRLGGRLAYRVSDFAHRHGNAA